MRLHGLRQRQHPIDDDLEAPRRGGLETHLDVGGRFAGRPDHGDLVVIEVLDVERHGAAAMAPAVTSRPCRPRPAKAFGNSSGSAMFSNTTLTPRSSVRRMTSAVRSWLR